MCGCFFPLSTCLGKPLLVLKIPSQCVIMGKKRRNSKLTWFTFGLKSRGCINEKRERSQFVSIGYYSLYYTRQCTCIVWMWKGHCTTFLAVDLARATQCIFNVMKPQELHYWLWLYITCILKESSNLSLLHLLQSNLSLSSSTLQNSRKILKMTINATINLLRKGQWILSIQLRDSSNIILIACRLYWRQGDKSTRKE